MAHEPPGPTIETPRLRHVWHDPRLADDARATPEAPAPVEMLAATVHAAARAWGGRRGLTWLDSGGGGGGDGRGGREPAESFLSAFPREVRRWGEGDGDLGLFLDALVQDARVDERDAAVGRFRGGWIGFLCYEAAAALEPVSLHASRDLSVPLTSWARHDVWFRHVPGEGRLELWSLDDVERKDRPDLSAWLHWAEEALRAPGDNTTPMWSPPATLRHLVPTSAAAVAARVNARGAHSLPRAAFERAVGVVQRAIREGEVFQANVAQRIALASDVDPFAVYVQLRRLNPSPFGCYVEEDWGALVSNSPERLFQAKRHGRGQAGLPGSSSLVLRARPIAGTCARSGDVDVDAAQVERMVASAKERAEHTMLVDLVRNDVGRVAEPGSVRVSEFQAVEAYSHVYHLVSDVAGRLRPGARFQDVVRAMFPGGTITGAPKLRSMEVIDRVEPVMRGPYTGSAGYVNGDGTADWNILIRTLVWTRGTVHAYAGAGIVADSDPTSEFEETGHKAAAMLGAWAAVHQAHHGDDDEVEADDAGGTPVARAVPGGVS